jgi:hypothetical protein
MMSELSRINSIIVNMGNKYDAVTLTRVVRPGLSFLYTPSTLVTLTLRFAVKINDSLDGV